MGFYFKLLYVSKCKIYLQLYDSTKLCIGMINLDIKQDYLYIVSMHTNNLIRCSVSIGCLLIFMCIYIGKLLNKKYII